MAVPTSVDRITRRSPLALGGCLQHCSNEV